MPYGTFNKAIAFGYRFYTYTESNTEYTIHVYKANLKIQRIACAVSEKVKALSELNPEGYDPSKVILKTNGNYLDRGGDPRAFYGIFYSNGVFSFDGKVGLLPSDRALSDVYYNENFFRAPPALCIDSKTTAATIRWPNYYGGQNCLTPEQLTKQYDVIISGQHCLVHNGVSVFESPCYSYEGITIADWNDLGNPYNHHNEVLGNGNSERKRARTFFGHGAKGVCYLVCVVGDHDIGDNGKEPQGMDLKVGARLMCDLDCDYAINMDGGSPTQMQYRDRDVYSTAGINVYKIGSAICACSQ